MLQIVGSRGVDPPPLMPVAEEPRGWGGRHLILHVCVVLRHSVTSLRWHSIMQCSLQAPAHPHWRLRGDQALCRLSCEAAGQMKVCGGCAQTWANGTACSAERNFFVSSDVPSRGGRANEVTD